MTEVLAAADALRGLGRRVNVWSVTSYTELARQGVAAERAQMLAASNADERPFVETLVAGEAGVFVAASGYMKALPLSIACWRAGHGLRLGELPQHVLEVRRLAGESRRSPTAAATSGHGWGWVHRPAHSWRSGTANTWRDAGAERLVRWPLTLSSRDIT